VTTLEKKNGTTGFHSTMHHWLLWWL